MSTLVQSPRLPLATSLTGSPLRWGRDLAIVGGMTGFAAPAGVYGLSLEPFTLTALTTGLVCGMLLGIEMPAFLESARRRVSLTGIAVRCVAVGAAVGAFIGFVAAQAAGEIFLAPFVLAGIAGALQLGWLWLPYTVLTVLERPTWPVVLGACVVAPLLGPVSLELSRLAVGFLF
ncbi:MAG TPA: hypothetical protein ENK18_24205 [Deltaproteobacteria bacterium]|nr:hypothetical protein [Deltaproteobacteria bacterium]